MNKILCISGGIDSIAAYYFLGKPDCIYFDTGVPSTKRELAMVKSMNIANLVIDKSLNFSESNLIHIPHRNLLFASRASIYGSEVVIAGLKDDKVEDKTFEAFRHMSLCLSAIGKYNVNVTSPFWEMTKADVLKWMMGNLKNPANLINRAVSCYSDMDHDCNRCNCCFRKACAMNDIGLVTHFTNEAMVNYYFDKAEEGAYDPERCESIKRFTAMWRDKRK